MKFHQCWPPWKNAFGLHLEKSTNWSPLEQNLFDAYAYFTENKQRLHYDCSHRKSTQRKERYELMNKCQSRVLECLIQWFLTFFPPLPPYVSFLCFTPPLL